MVIGASLKMVSAIKLTLVGDLQPRNQLHCVKVMGKRGRRTWQPSYSLPIANNAIIAKYLVAVKKLTVVKILGRAGAISASLVLQFWYNYWETILLTRTQGRVQMKYVFVVLVVLLCAGIIEGAGMTSEEIGWHGVLDMTDKSDIIVVGTIELMNAYYTEEVGNGTILTDVLVRIDQLIKGKPNVGTNHVKFAIRGGTAYIPKHEQVRSLTMLPNVEFDIGESVLLFLRVGDSVDYQDWPHGRLCVHMEVFGKRPIQNNKVQFLYESESKAKRTIIPLDLTKVLIQSYLTDNNASKAIENEIKGLVGRSSRTEHSIVLPSASATELKRKADKILKKEEK